MPLLQGRRNEFQSGEPRNIKKYLLSTPLLIKKKKFWVLDKKAMKTAEGHALSDPLP